MHASLMDAIRTGTALRSPTAASSAPARPTDARASLMDQISSGNFQLRSPTVARPSAPSGLAPARADPAAFGGIAGQIAAAMALRRKGSQLSANDESGADDDDSDDDW